MQTTDEFKDVQFALEHASWKQSNRGGPHEYILDSNYPVLVAKMKVLIHEHGKVEQVNGWRQRYFCICGYRYWVLPGIRWLPKCLVLNRVKI